MFNSSQEFLDYIKVLIENKKLSIKKINENILSLELIVEYLYKQNIVKIDLQKKNVNFELIAQDLYNKITVLIKENKEIKEENNDIKIRVKKLEEIINKLYLSNQSSNSMSKINSEIIENNDELDVIKSEIEKRINKQIKGINKLYQATKDGGELEIFHKKCDNIPNTLILYKTLGNRRFGGFTSKLWQNIVTIGKNCFLFSLDKKKIYPQKNENYYSIVSHSNNQGFYINQHILLNYKEMQLKKKI